MTGKGKAGITTEKKKDSKKSPAKKKVTKKSTSKKPVKKKATKTKLTKSKPTRQIKEKKEHPLTGKQELFCQEFIKHFNGTQAVIDAKYKVNSKNCAGVIAFENLRKHNIQRRLTDLKEERAKRNELDADYVLANIQDIFEKSMAAIPYMEKIDGEWKETGEYRINHYAALKAMELLGKHLDNHLYYLKV